MVSPIAPNKLIQPGPQFGLIYSFTCLELYMKGIMKNIDSPCSIQIDCQCVIGTHNFHPIHCWHFSEKCPIPDQYRAWHWTIVSLGSCWCHLALLVGVDDASPHGVWDVGQWVSFVWGQAPVPLSMFRSNSKFDENSECFSFEYTRPITTIFCTRHDSDTVVTCTKYRCDRPRIFYTRVFWIFIEFRIRSKYA